MILFSVRFHKFIVHWVHRNSNGYLKYSGYKKYLHVSLLSNEAFLSCLFRSFHDTNLKKWWISMIQNFCSHMTPLLSDAKLNVLVALLSFGFTIRKWIWFCNIFWNSHILLSSSQLISHTYKVHKAKRIIIEKYTRSGRIKCNFLWKGRKNM